MNTYKVVIGEDGSLFEDTVYIQARDAKAAIDKAWRKFEKRNPDVESYTLESLVLVERD